MKLISVLMTCVVVVACSPKAPQMSGQSSARETPRNYPEARRETLSDDYFGESVSDPYRWLEDPDSEETRAWIQAQNAITTPFLDSIPERTKVRERLEALWNYERFGLPYKKGGMYFYSHNSGLQNQNVLYVTDDLAQKGRVLLDPNTLSGDGTVALRSYKPSPDGKLLAYATSTGGSDWMEWHVQDIRNNQKRIDHLKWIKFSGVSWLPDSSGFYYSRYNEPKEGDSLEEANFYNKLYFHKLGDPQDKDTLIYERPDEKTWGFSGNVSDDGRFLIIGVWRGTGEENLVYYQDLKKKGSKILPLVSEWKAGYSALGNTQNSIYFQTNDGAPKGRIIEMQLDGSVKERIAEQAEPIESASFVGGVFFLNTLKDARARVRRFNSKGQDLGDLELPGLGSVSGFGGEQNASETFFSYSSFTAPSSVYRYDIKGQKSSLHKRPDVKFSPENFEVKQVFYPSKDGTKIPMFIAHKKGLKLGADTPAFLYGYGGFNISITPWFSSSRIVWMEMGGVLAVANLRGGGEYGEAWHKAGTKTQKQNVFDDFIAAAEYLVDEGYTSSQKLAINGRSNGGLLVGAAITQRPELFGAALPAVGVLDMLRFHKFTIGWAWVDDYGSVEKEDEYRALRAYSPYHNTKAGTSYPPTMIITADHDDRVVPAHSFKFAAALQHAHRGPQPILIRIDTKAGHGAQTPTSKRIDEVADSFSFLIKNLDVALPAEFAEK